MLEDVRVTKQEKPARTNMLRVRFTDLGVDNIDRLRGGWTRSEYVRQAVNDAIKAGKRGSEPADET